MLPEKKGDRPTMKKTAIAQAAGGLPEVGYMDGSERLCCTPKRPRARIADAAWIDTGGGQRAESFRTCFPDGGRGRGQGSRPRLSGGAAGRLRALLPPRPS